MLRAVITTHSSGAVEVAVTGVLSADEEEGAEGQCERIDLEGSPITTDCPELSPIAPELKEVAWGFGSFIVFAIVLRYVLFPKVREGMHQRYESIQSDRASADTLTAAARADVAAFEAQVAGVRAEAQSRVDAARSTLEAERAERIGAVNARIAERKAAIAAEADAARAAAMADVETAVRDVVSRATELATGRPAPASAVDAAVRSAMGTGVSS